MTSALVSETFCFSVVQCEEETSRPSLFLTAESEPGPKRTEGNKKEVSTPVNTHSITNTQAEL